MFIIHLCVYFLNIDFLFISVVDNKTSFKEYKTIKSPDLTAVNISEINPAVIKTSTFNNYPNPVATKKIKTVPKIVSTNSKPGKVIISSSPQNRILTKPQIIPSTKKIYSNSSVQIKSPNHSMNAGKRNIIVTPR